MTASNFGLYGFTAVTNQTKEGGSIVDLGYHFAATDNNGVPLDADLDGREDVAEDIDSDGY
jgi:hypothetical protein